MLKISSIFIGSERVFLSEFSIFIGPRWQFFTVVPAIYPQWVWSYIVVVLLWLFRLAMFPLLVCLCRANSDILWRWNFRFLDWWSLFRMKDSLVFPSILEKWTLKCKFRQLFFCWRYWSIGQQSLLNLRSCDQEQIFLHPPTVSSILRSFLGFGSFRVRLILCGRLSRWLV